MSAEVHVPGPQLVGVGARLGVSRRCPPAGPPPAHLRDSVPNSPPTGCPRRGSAAPWPETPDRQTLRYRQTNDMVTSELNSNQNRTGEKCRGPQKSDTLTVKLASLYEQNKSLPSAVNMLYASFQDKKIKRANHSVNKYFSTYLSTSAQCCLLSYATHDLP